MIEIYAPGTQVFLDGEISALITAVTLRAPGYIAYEVTWWDERTHRKEWFNAIELGRVNIDLKKTRVAFK